MLGKVCQQWRQVWAEGRLLRAAGGGREPAGLAADADGAEACPGVSHDDPGIDASRKRSPWSERHDWQPQTWEMGRRLTPRADGNAGSTLASARPSHLLHWCCASGIHRILSLRGACKRCSWRAQPGAAIFQPRASALVEEPAPARQTLLCLLIRGGATGHRIVDAPTSLKSMRLSGHSRRWATPHAPWLQRTIDEA